MGIFSRIGEIINANISTMLEKAENPEKMIRLMIHEMEDTLTEVKSSAAQVIAERIRIERSVQESLKQSREWQQRAELALGKDREDLAREALERKLSYDARTQELKVRLGQAEEAVRSYQEDIARLEDKLKSAYRRKKELLDKLKHAQTRALVEDKIQKANSASAFEKFDTYASRLDRLEADIEIARGSRSESLDARFETLEKSSTLDQELARLKQSRSH